MYTKATPRIYLEDMRNYINNINTICANIIYCSTVV